MGVGSETLGGEPRGLNPVRARKAGHGGGASRAVALTCLCHPQLMMTVGLLAVVVYLYTVVAFNFFRKFYNKSEDEDEPDMKCDDMMTVNPPAPVLWGQ